jgi:hypothetical protein
MYSTSDSIFRLAVTTLGAIIPVCAKCQCPRGWWSAKAQRWLKRHPRFHVYFTRTSASWLNMVERFFRDHREPTAVWRLQRHRGIDHGDRGLAPFKPQYNFWLKCFDADD